MASTADARRRRELRGHAAVLALLVVGSLPSCRKASRAEALATASASAKSVDPHADGQRLKAARADSLRRFQRAELADCSPLLEEPEERELCAATRSALATMRAALERAAPAVEIVPLTGALALSAQRASQALRARGMRRLLDERAAAPSASVRPSPPPRSAVHDHDHGHAHAAASAAPIRKQENRDLDAIGAYARVATLALRELASILELGPLPLRKTAFIELARLASEEPHWSGLRAIADEALLVEADLEQKRSLRGLREKLGG